MPLTREYWNKRRKTVEADLEQSRLSRHRSASNDRDALKKYLAWIDAKSGNRPMYEAVLPVG